MELESKGQISLTAAEALALLNLLEETRVEAEHISIIRARNLRRRELKTKAPDQIVQTLGQKSTEGLVAILTRELNDDIKLDAQTNKQLKDLLTDYNQRLNI